ncbi:MAG: hypothetical protein ACRDHG_06255 [Anaerolineales bacterium]
MDDPLPIHDLYIRALERRGTPSGSTLNVLRYSDHLLRRFGLAEFHVLADGQQRLSAARPVADEVWALVRGEVEFDWEDQRENSPTSGHTYQLRAGQPTVVLVPFGVAFRIRSLNGEAALVRLASEEDEGAS